MPYAESWLAWESASGGRATLAGSPSDIKAQYTGLVQALFPLFPPPNEHVNITQGEVNGIAYRLYTPKSHSSSSTPLPIMIWAHGGGYMTGDLDSDDFLCRDIAEKAGLVVLNVDYRLTPETLWPGQLEDCMGVYRWVSLPSPLLCVFLYGY